jgi:hydroxymethylbilane synthase
VAQAEEAASAIRKAAPGISIRLIRISTLGDRMSRRDPPPDTAMRRPAEGEVGVFVREIERALIEKRVDAAIHSLKDLPTSLHSGLVLAAVLPREDVRDCIVTRKGTPPEKLAAGAKIGTGSPRRTAQLLAAWPRAAVVPVRGNVDTRIRKVLSGELDAVVLARAGLSRLGFLPTSDRKTRSPHKDTVALRPEAEDLRIRTLPLSVMLPAPGQGAIAIEVRSDDEETRKVVEKTSCRETLLAVVAERSALEALGGGCDIPIGAYGRFRGRGANRRLILEGFLAPKDGNSRRARTSGRVASESEAAALGRRLAGMLARS